MGSELQTSTDDADNAALASYVTTGVEPGVQAEQKPVVQDESTVTQPPVPEGAPETAPAADNVAELKKEIEALNSKLETQVASQRAIEVDTWLRGDEGKKWLATPEGKFWNANNGFRYSAGQAKPYDDMTADEFADALTERVSKSVTSQVLGHLSAVNASQSVAAASKEFAGFNATKEEANQISALVRSGMPAKNAHFAVNPDKAMKSIPAAKTQPSTLPSTRGTVKTVTPKGDGKIDDVLVRRAMDGDHNAANEALGLSLENWMSKKASS